MSKSNSGDDVQSEEIQEGIEPDTIGDMDDVSAMDEIIPDVEPEEDIPSQEFGEIENELSLEDVREDEERKADDEDEEEDR
jgi:hypothetical protein